MIKIIHVLTYVLQDLVTKAMTLLGMYAAYELIFNSDMPIFALAALFITIMIVSWASSIEAPKAPAIPITIIPEDQAKPTMIGQGRS